MDAVHHLLKYRYDSIPGIILGIEEVGAKRYASVRLFTGQSARAAVPGLDWVPGDSVEVLLQQSLDGCGEALALRRA